MTISAGSTTADIDVTGVIDDPLDDLAVRCFVQIALGLQAAHAQGVLHRDLKPSNIMVGAHGQVLVVDWGLARPIGERGSRGVDPSTGSEHTSRVGTPGYMPPEQARGESELLDQRSDIYSLGVVAFELLGGVLPYAVRGKAVHAATRTICEQEPIRPRSLESPCFQVSQEWQAFPRGSCWHRPPREPRTLKLHPAIRRY